MKVFLLVLIFVTIWWWSCATPLPCASEGCPKDVVVNPAHPCKNQEPDQNPEPSLRSKRNVLSNMVASVKNATSYVGRKVHLIHKREGSKDHDHSNAPKNNTGQEEELLENVPKNDTDKAKILSRVKRDGTPENFNYTESRAENCTSAEQEDDKRTSGTTQEEGTVTTPKNDTVRVKRNYYVNDTEPQPSPENVTSNEPKGFKEKRDTSELLSRLKQDIAPESKSSSNGGTDQEQNYDRQKRSSTQQNVYRRKTNTTEERLNNGTDEVKPLSRVKRHGSNTESNQLPNNGTDDVAETPLRVRRDTLDPLAKNSTNNATDNDQSYYRRSGLIQMARRRRVQAERKAFEAEVKKMFRGKRDISEAKNKTLDNEATTIRDSEAVNETTVDEVRGDTKPPELSNLFNEAELNSTTKSKRSSDGGDTRYMLIHDVPPYRRKRDLEEYDQSESQGKSAPSNAKQPKNVTIIIQNLRQQETSLPLDDVNSTSSADDLNRAKRWTAKVRTTKKRHSSPRDKRDIGSTGEPSAGRSQDPIDPLDEETSPTSVAKRGYFKKIDKKKCMAEQAAAKPGRKLLSFNVEADRGSDLDASSDEKLDAHPKGSTRLQLQAFVQHNLELTAKVNHIRCACALFFDEPDSDDKNPIIAESFLETAELTTVSDREIVCSRVCSETSRLYFSSRQVVLCAHVQNFHHRLQVTVPIEHSSIEGDSTETIFCQVLPREAGPPLHYIVSWLNIILLDVTVCLTGLAVVCLYLICRKRKLIPVYTTANFATLK